MRGQASNSALWEHWSLHPPTVLTQVVDGPLTLGLLSDSHGQSERTSRAVRLLLDAGAAVLVHAGDIGSGDSGQRVLGALRQWNTPAWFVWGNNDLGSSRPSDAFVRAAGLPIPASGAPTVFTLRQQQQCTTAVTIAVFHGHEFFVHDYVRALTQPSLANVSLSMPSPPAFTDMRAQSPVGDAPVRPPAVGLPAWAAADVLISGHSHVMHDRLLSGAATDDVNASSLPLLGSPVARPRRLTTDRSPLQRATRWLNPGALHRASPFTCALLTVFDTHTTCEWLPVA